MCQIIPIFDDATFEPDEIFFVSLLSSEANVDPTRAQVAVNIINNDPSAPSIGFTQTAYGVSEGEGFQSVCVEVSGVVSESFSASVETTDGSATNGLDYETTADILVFNDANTQCVNITIFPDLISEEDETFTVELESQDVVATLPTTTVFISDVPPPTIGFTQTTYLVPESGLLAQVCVQVNGVVTASFTAMVTVNNGTAVSPSDYGGIPVQTTLTFTDGQTQCVVYSINDDTVDENDESFFVDLTSTDVSITLLSGSASVIIEDDDFAVIVFEQSSYVVAEEDIFVEVCAIVNGLLERNYDVNFLTFGGSATDPEDYVGIAQLLTFTQFTPRRCVQVTINNDTIDEEEQEFFRVQLTQVVQPPVIPQSIDVFIVDNDEVSLGFQAENYAVNEGTAFVTVCVETDGPLDRNGVVGRVTTSEVTAEDGEDYIGVTAFPLTFNAGVTQLCFSVVILDDFLNEPTEEFTIFLTSTDAGVFSSMATVSILDNDDFITIGFENSTYFTNELIGTVEVCVAKMTGQLQQPIIATVTSADVDAQAGQDYFAVAETVTLTSTATRQCFSVTILDDLFIVEDRESFLLQLTTSDPNVIVTTPTATVFIDDNDEELAFVQSTYITSEDSISVTVCVEVTSAPIIPELEMFATIFTSDITATAVGNQDYTPVATTLTFDSNNLQRCITISITNDLFSEPTQSFLLTLQSQTAVIPSPFATVFIEDDDSQLLIVFTQEEYPVEEDVPSGVVTVIVQLIGLLEPGGSIGATVSATNGSATGGLDFTPISVPLVFTSGGPSFLPVDIAILDDELPESDEVFTVSVSSMNNVDSATVRIINDDSFINITLLQSEYTFNEDEDVPTVCVDLIGNNVLGMVVDIELHTIDGTAVGGSPGSTTADYISEVTTIQYAAPQQEVIICEQLELIDDLISEPLETFSVQLSVITMNINVMFMIDSATITIVDNDDDDVPPPTIGFTQTTYLVPESGLSTVCVQVSGVVMASFTAIVTVNDGTAVSPSDYSGIPVQTTLTFTDGQTQCVVYSINDDTVDENDENFFVALTSTDVSNTLLSGSASVIIEDDDFAVIVFEQPSYVVAEEDVFVEVCAIVNGLLERNYDVNFLTFGGSATDPEDYVGIAQLLTFTQLTPRRCVQVTINNDIIDEEEQESFRVQLTQVVQPPVNSQSVDVFIVDNDEVSLGFQQTNYAVNEGTAFVTVCVETDGPLDRNGVVGRVTTSAVTAEDGEDYIGVAAFPLTFNAGVTQLCFSVEILDDFLDEPTEEFTIFLTSTDAGVFSSMATVSILDNDDAQLLIVFTQEEYPVEEDVPSGVVTVIVQLIGLLEPGGSIGATVSTTSGSATGGLDFTPISVPLVFTFGGPSFLPVDIAILDDDLPESDEVFTVSVSSMNNVDSATVRIINDDAFISITLLQSEYTFNEDEVLPTVCVDLIGNNVLQVVDIELRTIDGTAVGGPPGSTTADYISEVTTIQYATPQQQVIICEELELIDDLIFEPLETFTVELSVITMNINVMFVIDSATITIVDNDAGGLVIGFGETGYAVNETDVTEEFVFCLLANGAVDRTYSIQVTATGVSAVAGLDFPASYSTFITFTLGGDNIQCGGIDIEGDLLIEDDEVFLLELEDVSGVPSGSTVFSPASATVVILDDDRREFQPPEAPITLVNDTPSVSLAPSGTATVRVDYTLRSDVVSATCGLLEVFGETVCTSVRTVTFQGLDPNRQAPLTLAITAFDISGQTLDIISRPVRLGLNGDCAVNFVNGVEQAQTFNDIVFIEWIEVGPVVSTDCSFDDGTFIPCTSPYQRNGLTPGSHMLKVRPDGPNCVRSIRRTADFQIV